jgi:hypothetical protein
LTAVNPAAYRWGMPQYVKIKVEGETLEVVAVGQAMEWLEQQGARRALSRQAVYKAIATGRIRAFYAKSVKGKRPVALVDPAELLSLANGE